MIVLKKLKLTLLLGISALLTSQTYANQYDGRQIECLAKNVYFESRGEPEKGQIAVIYTTLNRAKSGKYPTDLCRVVYQKNQFSWTAKRNHVVKEKEVYKDIKETVHEVLSGKHKDVTNGALYFHANSIKKPRDFGNVKCTARIGKHVFYKP